MTVKKEADTIGIAISRNNHLDNKMRNFLLLMVLIISGCTGKSIYRQPHIDVDNAQLRLVSIPRNNNVVRVANPAHCVTTREETEIATLGANANLVRSLSRIGMPMYNAEINERHQNEVYIPAGKEFAFEFNGVGISGFSPGQTSSAYGTLYAWCRIVIVFRPENNAYYEAVYNYVETPEGKETCDATLYEIKANIEGEFSKTEVSNYRKNFNYCN